MEDEFCRKSLLGSRTMKLIKCKLQTNIIDLLHVRITDRSDGNVPVPTRGWQPNLVWCECCYIAAEAILLIVDARWVDAWAIVRIGRWTCPKNLSRASEYRWVQPLNFAVADAVRWYLVAS